MEAAFVLWPSIPNWANLLKQHVLRKDSSRPNANLNVNSMEYRAKPKIHGCNCAIGITSTAVSTQSRHHKLTKQAGARVNALVSPNASYFQALFPAVFRLPDLGTVFAGKEHTSLAQITLFGEWAGMGVQKFVAVSEVPKFFAVFSVLFMFADGQTEVLIEPKVITALLDSVADRPSSLFVLPWVSDLLPGLCPDLFVFDLEAGQISPGLEQIVAEVDRRDPWAEAVFAVQGPGEGLVMYPSSQAVVYWDTLSQFMFKAKGETHQGPKQVVARSGLQDPLPSTVEQNDFVLKEVSNTRILQAVEETKAESKRDTNAVADWVWDNIEKECYAELEELTRNSRDAITCRKNLKRLVKGRAAVLFHRSLSSQPRALS